MMSSQRTTTKFVRCYTVIDKYPEDFARYYEMESEPEEMILDPMILGRYSPDNVAGRYMGEQLVKETPLAWVHMYIKVVMEVPHV